MERKSRMILRYLVTWQFRFALGFLGLKDWAPEWSAVAGLAIAVLKVLNPQR
jgi:TorA maturation chaperone TorD